MVVSPTSSTDSWEGLSEETLLALLTARRNIVVGLNADASPLSQFLIPDEHKTRFLSIPGPAFPSDKDLWASWSEKPEGWW